MGSKARFVFRVQQKFKQLSGPKLPHTCSTRYATLREGALANFDVLRADDCQQPQQQRQGRLSSADETERRQRLLQVSLDKKRQAEARQTSARNTLDGGRPKPSEEDWADDEHRVNGVGHEQEKVTGPAQKSQLEVV